MSIEQTSLFALNIKAIEQLKLKFPQTYNEMRDDAFRRFKFQQISLAYQFKNYFNMCIEEFDKIDEPRILDSIKISDQALDKAFFDEVSSLPIGSYIPGHGFLNYLKVNNLKSKSIIMPSETTRILE